MAVPAETLTAFLDEVGSNVDDHTMMEDVNEILRRFVAEAGQGPLAVPAYLHPRVITYKDKALKDHWVKQQIDSPNARDFWGAWEKAAAGEAFTKIGVFVTWGRTPVQDPAPSMDQVWHCWGAALVKNGAGQQGKNLYIWDNAGGSGFKPDERARALLIGAQKSMMDRLPHKPATLWLSRGDDTKSRCVAETLEWALTLAAQADAPYSPQDPRFSGFERLTDMT
ncbi:MAG: hypothetical protein Q9183_002310 [Haloplaca sp. 2 TL-2023]